MMLMINVLYLYRTLIYYLSMSKNQNGFGVVEGLLILVIVGILGGTGWYVWNSNNKTNDLLNSAEKSSSIGAKATKKNTVTKNEAVDKYPSWKEEKNQEYKYSFKFPNENGWKSFINMTEANSQPYSIGERINNTGVDYTLCGSNCGLVFGLRVFAKGTKADVGPHYAEDTEMKGNQYYKLTSKSAVSINGTKGTRWEYAPGDESASNIIYYYFTNDKYAYYITVNLNGAKTDKVDLTKSGEEIFSTLKFLN
jgi:Tfp pilus assembly protein PilE